MTTTEHFKKFSIIKDGIEINLNMARFTKQYKRAQYELDGNVMNSMVPFMPHYNGTFIQVTRSASAAMQGTGKVYAAYGVQGRFLYEGKVMVDELTGSPWARKGAKKVLVSQYAGKTKAKENITYTKTHNTEAQSHWFDVAKARDGRRWIENAKRTAGGG